MDLTQDTFCILMEYANAGTLPVEILRQANRHMTEDGARYYMRELIAGVSYLHSKNIVHDDLHMGNVVLKYNPDGRAKRCLICDLGNCAIPTWLNVTLTATRHFYFDILSLKELMTRMLEGMTNETAPENNPVPHAGPHMTFLNSIDVGQLRSIAPLSLVQWSSSCSSHQSAR